MSSLSWLGKTLCPPDCLVKNDIKAPSCAAIFRLGIVVLQCVRTGEVFCGLHVAHVHIICPVRDVTHVRKCTRPSPAFPYCKRRKAGRGPGNEARKRPCRWSISLVTSLVPRPMIVVFGLGTRLHVRMRTTLENGVLRNGQQPQSVVNGFY